MDEGSWSLDPFWADSAAAIILELYFSISRGHNWESSPNSKDTGLSELLLGGVA